MIVLTAKVGSRQHKVFKSKITAKENLLFFDVCDITKSEWEEIAMPMVNTVSFRCPKCEERIEFYDAFITDGNLIFSAKCKGCKEESYHSAKFIRASALKAANASETESFEDWNGEGATRH
jgi:transcription initiation factor IIE alpha subunit